MDCAKRDRAFRVAVIDRFAAFLLVCLAAGLACVAQGETAMPKPAAGDTAPVDYRDPARWICRPENGASPCRRSVDDAEHGRETTESIDCFYVYPTASLAATYYSDLESDAAVKGVVRAQAAWLSTHCRVFAPVYHQVTIAGLKWELSQTPGSITSPIDIPYRDVVAAWRDYLEHDNSGRGVVLIGHSQGSRILARLIAEEIDGKPAQALLVSAYLAGNSSLTAKSFHAIAPCRFPNQTGCVVAWSSYRDDYEGPRLFGAAPKNTEPICVNPAAIEGGRGALKPAGSTPDGAHGNATRPDEGGSLTAECVTDEEGAVLRVRIGPSPRAGDLDSMLRPSRAGPAWGLHPHDISLVQGNLADLLARQAATWLMVSNRPPPKQGS